MMRISIRLFFHAHMSLLSATGHVGIAGAVDPVTVDIVIGEKEVGYRSCSSADKSPIESKRSPNAIGMSSVCPGQSAMPLPARAMESPTFLQRYL